MTKTRTQEISAANGGDECEGPDSLDQNCNVRDCPGIEIYFYNILKETMKEILKTIFII